MRIIKLEQPSCNPCKMVGNYLNDKGLKYDVFDVFERPDIALKYGAMSTPITILLDDEDNEIQRVVGFNPSQLEELIEQL